MILVIDSSGRYVVDNDGCTPFHLCVRENHVSIFFELSELLMESSLDAVDAIDARCRNVLHIAIKQNNMMAVLALLETH